jgi:hypothetical protein
MNKEFMVSFRPRDPKIYGSALPQATSMTNAGPGAPFTMSLVLTKERRIAIREHQMPLKPILLKTSKSKAQKSQRGSRKLERYQI